MSWIDYLVIIMPLAFVFLMGWRTRRYMKSVADFMSGGRLAGRYLLTVARGEQMAGAVMFVATFEMIAKAGFTLSWWWSIQIPVGFFVAVTGFVIYRYRETRAMTLAQFFEIRYSKKFRVFTGMLGFFAGILNFGIIPAVGARFITHFLGLPATVMLGGHEVMTYVPVMAVLLSFTVYLTISGGLVSVMVTDCIEGIVSQLLYLVIIGALLYMFSWTEISEVLGKRPAGESLLNPFDSSGVEDFNVWYILMGAFVSIYGTMAWQNSSAYNAAGLTPHENRMGNILGRWRDSGRAITGSLLGVCALVFLYHPDFTAQGEHVRELVSRIPDSKMQEQMLLPIAVTELLPIGIKGALCVILIMGIFGGDSTHLHSWSGLFIQDVLVPLRKKTFGPKRHILALRLSVIGVALFVFLFGAFFPPTEYIIMWWGVTMAIYVGGAGAVIIGGLYWKKGTEAGAWTALLTGSTLAVSGILMRLLCREGWLLDDWFGGKGFPLNGMQISFFASLVAAASYVVVSWLTCREDFNMSRMLHRGEYAKLKQAVGDAHELPATANRKVSIWGKLIGFDENFTLGDKWITGTMFGLSLWWVLIFAVGTVWNFIAPWPLHVWSTYWHIVGICYPVFMAVVTGIWFTWGGIRDIKDLFSRLKSEKVNHLDDGTVIGNQNLDERQPAGNESTTGAKEPQH
jgi:SSS family solute:Na+ symporter